MSRPFDHEPTKSESELTLEQKKALKNWIMEEMQRTVEPYEFAYLSREEWESFQVVPFNRSRMVRFQAWIEQLAEQRHWPEAFSFSQLQLEEDLEKVVMLYQALCDLAANKMVSDEAWKGYIDNIHIYLASDEFCLLREDFPTWRALPSTGDLKKEFGLTSVLDDYRRGRSISDFDLTDQALINIGYAYNPFNSDNPDNTELRRLLLESVNEQVPVQEKEIGQVIDAKEILKRILEDEGTLHNNFFSLQEALVYFDEIGVRPANLVELLAFAKKNPPRTDELNIFAIGSVFSNEEKDRYFFPYLNWNNGAVNLDSQAFEDHTADEWPYGYSEGWFLVFPKTT